MIGVDTNVLLRFLVNDDPAQGLTARQFMSERTSEDPAYISSVVLTETIWFLGRQLGYPKPELKKVLGLLVRSAEIVVEHSAELELLITDPSRQVTDIADHLVAWSGLQAGCSTIVTFDKKAASRVPGMELLA